jgi:hypothetical protein
MTFLLLLYLTGAHSRVQDCSHEFGLTYVSGALASSALFGRDDDPKAAIEAAARAVAGALAGPARRASSQARGRTRLANFEMFRHLSACGCGEDYRGSFSENLVRERMLTPVLRAELRRPEPALRHPRYSMLMPQHYQQARCLRCLYGLGHQTFLCMC